MGWMKLATIIAIVTVLILHTEKPAIGIALALTFLFQALGWYMTGRGDQQRATQEEC